MRWEFACVFEWCEEQTSIWLEKSDSVLMKDFVMYAEQEKKRVSLKLLPVYFSFVYDVWKYRNLI